MPSYLSSKNITTVPLLASTSFVGGIEYTLNYTCCDITCNTDQDSLITVYGSQDQVNFTTIFSGSVTGGVSFFTTQLLFHPWTKTTLQNTSTSDQTFLNYELIYRVHSHVMDIANASLVTLQNVNIHDSYGNDLLSNGVAGNALLVDNSANIQPTDILRFGGFKVGLGQTVKGASMPVTLASDQTGINVNIAAQSAGLALDTSIQTIVAELGVPAPGGNLWSAASVVNTNTSASINCSAKNIGIVSIFGNSSTASVLTVQYSPDNTNWFSSSHIITIASGGDFSLDFQSSAVYIRLIASGIATSATISAWLNRV